MHQVNCLLWKFHQRPSMFFLPWKFQRTSLEEVYLLARMYGSKPKKVKQTRSAIEVAHSRSKCFMNDGDPFLTQTRRNANLFFEK